MGITINSNIKSLNAQKSLTKSLKDLNKADERLSSGKRINRGADDAAGLAIAAQLGLIEDLSAVAARNTSDLASALQIADGGLESISGITQRLDELAVQSANGTLSDADRTALAAEFDALVAEVDRLAQTNQFNGQALIAQDSTISGQVGVSGGDTIDVQLKGVSAASLGLSGLDISTQAGAQAALDQVSQARDTVIENRGVIGASQSRLNSAFETLQEQRVQSAAAKSRIVDADIAQETANRTRANILAQAGTSVLGQANQSPALALSLLGGG